MKEFTLTGDVMTDKLGLTVPAASCAGCAVRYVRLTEDFQPPDTARARPLQKDADLKAAGQWPAAWNNQL